MKMRRLALIVTVCCLAGCGGQTMVQRGALDPREAMKQSLVYLEISSYSYDQLRPWRNADVEQKTATGCAVGDYEVITPAWNLTDATLIQAKRFGKNEYIAAKVKAIDYEIDLALLELDANAAGQPLRHVRFVERFTRGAKLDYYWLSEDDKLNAGQGYLDRAGAHNSTVSFTRFLNYVVTNTSGETGNGQVYCDGASPVGIACWGDETKEAGLIPAAVINAFMADAADGNYGGVPCVGFTTAELLDPAVRAYLKMPATMTHGVLVSDVFRLGTGSDSLEPNDVILAIDGRGVDAYGRFQHPVYDSILFDQLIMGHKVGDKIAFAVWRQGAEQQIQVEAKNIRASQMLLPYYEYGQQPQYVVTGGFVFQKLTRPYLTAWGPDWQGKVSPHLYHYLRDLAFKPTEQRRDIVILGYVLPAPVNLGYKDLAQIVVKKFNGMEIHSIADILAAQKLNPDSKYDVVEFELDNPKVVIPRAALPLADSMIAQNYGVTRPANIAQ